MFKLLTACLLVLMVTDRADGCHKKKAATCYQGRVEVIGMCRNYTLSVTSGSLEGVAASYTDSQTGKTYSNVFSPADPCSIPAHLKAGDTFYFVVDNRSTGDCAVCMAYYPKPEQQIGIRVVPGPCR